MRKSDIVILLDPGHGGKDPGAIAVHSHSIQEKNIVLSVSKILQKKINSEPGYQAKLSRKNDTYISLQKRINLAKKERADLFISIHADAFTHPRARGASVYILSERGASSKAAKILANKANRESLISSDGNTISLNHTNEDLNDILLDLSISAVIKTSHQIAGSVLNSLNKVAHLHSSSVEQAGFIVLKSADIPSILVEIGYISNPWESKKLAQKKYQEKIAHAIFSGILNHFEQFPPYGKSIFFEINTQQYTVQPGDTLSEIANKFNISTKKLMNLNKLKSSQIYSGQTLKINL